MSSPRGPSWGEIDLRLGGEGALAFFKAGRLVATVNLFSTGEFPRDRVFRHAQVVEDETRPEREFAHHLSDGLRGFLK